MVHLTACSWFVDFDGIRPTDLQPDAPPDVATDGAVEPDAFACVLECPSGYVDLGAPSALAKYQVFSSQMSFDNAEAMCEATRGASPNFTHLVVLDDQAELDRIAAAINPVTNVRIGHRRDLAIGAFYLPVSLQPENQFPPLSGAPWNAGEPSGGECADISINLSLNAGPCSSDLAFVCECDCYAPR